MITFTHVNRRPLTFAPLTTRTGVLSGYSFLIVDESLSQSLVSQSERTLTPDLSATSLYRTQPGFGSGVDCTTLLDGVAIGVGVRVAGVGVAETGVAETGVAETGLGVAAVATTEDGVGEAFGAADDVGEL